MAASAAPTMTGVAPTMKSVLFYQPGDIRYEDIPTPKPGPGELLIRVRRALTCGTDLKAFRRGHPVLLKNLPSPFGHECTGEVVARGAGAAAGGDDTTGGVAAGAGARATTGGSSSSV